MSSQTTDIVSNGDVDFYFTGVQQAYLRALKGNNRALYPKFAFVPPATGMTTSKFPMDLPGGRQALGTRVKFPVSLAASRPEIWPYGTARKVEPFSQIEISVDLKRWAPPAKQEQWDIFTNDIFGIIKDQLPQMMDRSMVLWDMVLADVLAANAAWQPDNIPFFTPAATPHQANPFKPDVATFYTDYPISGLDVPNMRYLLGQLENAPGPDDLPLDTNKMDIITLTPTSDFKFQLNQVFEAAIAAQAVGANAAAGVSNMLVGAARVELYKQLARTKTQPRDSAGVALDRTKVGYLLAVPKGEGKPIALVPSRQPTPFYHGLNGNDYLRATEGAMQYGWDAFGQGVLVIPQRALRFYIP